MPPTLDQHQCLGRIRWYATAVQEVQDERIIQQVPAAEIQRASLEPGRIAPHPLVQLIFGLLLLGVGLVPVWHVLSAGIGAVVGIEMFFLGFAALGGWVIYESLQKGYILQLDTTRGRKRLVIGTRVTAQQADAFATVVQRDFGVAIMHF